MGAFSNERHLRRNAEALRLRRQGLKWAAVGERLENFVTGKPGIHASNACECARLAFFSEVRTELKSANLGYEGVRRIQLTRWRNGRLGLKI